MIFQRARRAPGRSLWYFIGAWGLARYSCEVYCRLSFKLRVWDRHLVPRTGPLVYVCNHQSFLDLMACGAVCKDRPFTPMARKSLWNHPFMDWYLRQYHAIPVDRDGKAGTTAVKAALRELDAGRCVLIYPEGSRSEDGTLADFERGLMVLIKRGGAPVVPISIDGAYECWRRGEPRPRWRGHMGILAQAPLDPMELLSDGADIGLDRLRRVIETGRLEVRRRLRERYGPNAVTPNVADVPFWERDDADSAAGRDRHPEELQAGE